MMEDFLDQIRLEGKLRVVSTQDAHSINQLAMSPVITRDCQVGILLQDKTSGKSWMIEVTKDFYEIDTFVTLLRSSFNDALACHLKLQAIIKDKANVS